MQRVILYGLAGGVLLALLKLIEYKHFVHAYPTEIYGGLVAVILAGRAGLKRDASLLPRWHRSCNLLNECLPNPP